MYMKKMPHKHEEKITKLTRGFLKDDMSKYVYQRIFFVSHRNGTGMENEYFIINGNDRCECVSCMLTMNM